MSVAAALDQTFSSARPSASRDHSGQCPHGSIRKLNREESGLKLVHGFACSGRTPCRSGRRALRESADVAGTSTGQDCIQFSCRTLGGHGHETATPRVKRETEKTEKNSITGRLLGTVGRLTPITMHHSKDLDEPDLSESLNLPISEIRPA